MNADPRGYSETEVADWLLATLRLFGADEANAHRIIALFLEAVEQDDAQDR